MFACLSTQDVPQIAKERVAAGTMPYLQDESVRARAAQTAEAQGLLERIQHRLTPEQPIPVLPHTRFRDYRRDGNRTRYQALQAWRGSQIEQAAIACWLGLDYVDYLQDLLWAECEATTWVMPAHEHPDRPVDLRVAGCGEKYAVLVTLLADKLDDEVRNRVAEEVKCRVLDPFLDPLWRHGWKTTTNNWNAVCHACTCIAAMLLERQPDRLAAILSQSLENLDAFLRGFTDDGGCTEGPSYWRYGFGHYAHLAACLCDFSGGRINIMDDEKVERICRYPLAASVAPGQQLEFADAHSGFLPVSTAVEINRFHDVGELFGLCEVRDDGCLAVHTLQDLLLYGGRRHEPYVGPDAYLPDLAVARVRAGSVTVGAKAGHNAEHHNHNDVGSFIVHRGGTFFLCDPGAPIYSRQTFSPRRYESVFCNSFGHSVPAIDGGLQPNGAERAGTMGVEGLDTQGAKTIRIEMARAYDAAKLKSLTRTIELDGAGEQVSLTDRFVFSEAPDRLEEAFMTYQPAEAAEGGTAVRIASDADGTAVLTADGAAGTFAVRELTEESARECRHGGLLRRITFAPAHLAQELTLRFVLRWQ